MAVVGHIVVAEPVVIPTRDGAAVVFAAYDGGDAVIGAYVMVVTGIDVEAAVVKAG
jgi:hypothetical protein